MMSAQEAQDPRQDRVLVIDDDEVMLLSCQEVLTRAGYLVETFDNGPAGIRRVGESPPAVLVVDLKMPEIDGFEVIREVRRIAPEVVIVVITGYATIATAVDAMKLGAYDFLPKPFTPPELRVIIGRGVERWRLARESERWRREKEALEHRFVAFVSHQLKSPLANVKQYLDVLQHLTRGKLPERASDWIARCQARTAEMAAMIDDWLTLARLEKGALSEDGSSVDLATVVSQVVKDCEPQAAAAGVSVRMELPGGLPRVHGDRSSLGMVVANLLGNAIKYNRRAGQVILRATRREETVELEIEDSGIGIPEQCVPELFQEFYRAKTPATEGIPGTGLGLAICKKIVSELGGSIRVKSQEGVGSVFALMLPVGKDEPDGNKGASA